MSSEHFFGANKFAAVDKGDQEILLFLMQRRMQRNGSIKWNIKS